MRAARVKIWPDDKRYFVVMVVIPNTRHARLTRRRANARMTGLARPYKKVERYTDTIGDMI